MNISILGTAQEVSEAADLLAGLLRVEWRTEPLDRSVESQVQVIIEARICVA
jgi:hypothetical protein